MDRIHRIIGGACIARFENIPDALGYYSPSGQDAPRSVRVGRFDYGMVRFEYDVERANRIGALDY